MQDEIGFAQIGRLRSEEVDHSAVFKAATDTGRGFRKAFDEKKKRDAAERRKGYVVEDTEKDVAQLEAANPPAQSVTDFVTSDPARPEETNEVRQLRRQGGSASVAAELVSRRAHLDRLKNAPPEDLSFIQEQYRNRGNASSAKQFLDKQEANRAASVSAVVDEIEATVKAETGIDLLIENKEQFLAEWTSNDPKWADHKTTLEETSIRKLDELKNANDPEGVAVRIGTWIGDSTTGSINDLLRVSQNASRPDIEARSQDFINTLSTQFEARIARVPEPQKTRLTSQFQERIGFITRIADGSATRDEIKTHQARATLNNTRLNAKKIKADTALTKAQLANEQLQQQRKNMENMTKLNDQIQGIRDSQVLLKGDSNGVLDVTEMTPLERLVYEDPDTIRLYEEAIYDIQKGVMEGAIGERGVVDIGDAGVVKLSGPIEELTNEQAVGVAKAYLTTLASGSNPFVGEDGEKGLKLFMDFTANRMNTLTPAQRQQAFGELRGVMNTPEFAQIASENPRAFKPWVNLVQAETQQRGANLLGSLSENLYNDPHYKAAIAQVKTNIDADINSGARFRRAQVEAKPEYYAERIQAPLATLAAKIDAAGGDSSLVDTLVDETSKHGVQYYMNFMGKKGFQENISSKLQAEVDKLEDGSGAKAELQKVLDATDGYYGGQAHMVQNKFANATNPTDVYNTLAEAVVVDQEAFEKTGVYTVKTSDAFVEAFKEYPSVLDAARSQVSLQNNSAEMRGFRNSLLTMKNVEGTASVQDAYERFRLARPARGTQSLTPSLRDEAPAEVFTP